MPPFCCYNYFGVEFSYEKYHVHHGGDQEEKKANYTDIQLGKISRQQKAFNSLAIGPTNQLTLDVSSRTRGG